MKNDMSVKTETKAVSGSARRVVGVVLGSFSVILLLSAVAYSVTANVVNWVTVDYLAYPVHEVAPFVVISGAILTIPIIIPTVLVSVKILQ
ncbi:hypothetical protein [Natronorubrum thiooxidans]|uniref:Uncharacterized protein n=1 Tax=Natronorubrum thiooxidans TaxID=308853 RepID=A0A1N7GX32_9EURY|nr:hypothetical protein [Natronorubrum thiooxidans]SIS17134.1 hypothetical protein SAMN05421752_11710 [Natronorubrum thiooxidans]